MHHVASRSSHVANLVKRAKSFRVQSEQTLVFLFKAPRYRIFVQICVFILFRKCKKSFCFLSLQAGHVWPARGPRLPSPTRRAAGWRSAAGRLTEPRAKNQEKPAGRNTNRQSEDVDLWSPTASQTAKMHKGLNWESAIMTKICFFKLFSNIFFYQRCQNILELNGRFTLSLFISAFVCLNVEHSSTDSLTDCAAVYLESII